MTLPAIDAAAPEGVGYGQTLHGEFRAQARRTPRAVALEAWDTALTYRELDRRSDRVAADLARRGVGPGCRVGLHGERGVAAIVGILAVLKVGAAYVPVDPRQPAERTASQLADAGVALVLATPAALDRVPKPFPAVAIDGTAGGAAPPRRRSDPTAPAYVIFTSGSTGRPKGTVVPHAGLVELAEDQMVRWRARPGTRVLQFAPLSFDASVTEIMVALLSGATLCLAEQDDLMPGPDLRRTLAERRVTAFKAPPAVLAATDGADLPDLRLVVSGGGACTPDVVERWAVGREFRNAYGTTETSVCNAMTGPLCPGDPIVLGEPVGGSRLYVLCDGQPVGCGEVGELCIGGTAVADGYWNRPALTAARFVPDPQEDGARIYRTGDLVRREPAGLVFLGRTDDQLKLRGHRVEPAEVEATLVAHCGVRGAAVTASDDRLVAFVVPGPGGLDRTALRREVAEHLPGYMVPAVVVEIPALPLTERGKVDRAALPDVPPTAVVGPVRAADPVLAAWCEVLGVDDPDPEQDFFHLGGDSLQAANLVARISAAVGTQVPLRTLLRAPTLGALTAAVAVFGRTDREQVA